MPRSKTSKSTPTSPNISQKELVRVYGRLHSNLARQVREAQRENKKAKGKDPVLKRKYSEAAKELYAYVRLMELCQMLSKDVVDMREILDAISKSTLDQSGRPN